jgi:hypothetical protein
MFFWPMRASTLSKIEDQTCAVKLDMHKAYDRVEWVFLENMIRHMGFEERWISLMMASVSLMRYQVRFNSDKTGMFTPTRGLPQGETLFMVVLPLVGTRLGGSCLGFLPNPMCDNIGGMGRELQRIHCCSILDA